MDILKFNNLDVRDETYTLDIFHIIHSIIGIIKINNQLIWQCLRCFWPHLEHKNEIGRIKLLKHVIYVKIITMTILFKIHPNKCSVVSWRIKSTQV